MTHRSRSLQRRSRRSMAVALAIVGASLIASAPRASAAFSGMTCNYDGRTVNACLTMTPLGYGSYDANVGVDVNLPQQYARDIITCGADFSASLWGDDGGGSADDYIPPVQ